MFRPNMLSRALPFRVYIVTILKALIIIIETLVVKYQFWVYKIRIMFALDDQVERISLDFFEMEECRLVGLCTNSGL